MDGSRIRAMGLALVVGIVAALTFSASASAATKPFGLVICAPGETCTTPPSSSSAVNSALVPPSAASQPMTATFTNENKKGTGINLGSANLTPPPGFTVDPDPTKISISGCSGCTVTVMGKVVQLRGAGLIPGTGAAVKINMHVITPASGYSTITAPQSPWGVEVKQSNDFSGPPGNDLTLDTNTSSTYTVLTNLAFNVEPADAQVNTNITGTDYSAAGSPVEVQAEDTAGNPVTWFSGTVTVALEINPTGADFTPGSVTSVEAGSGGIAQFKSLALDTPGYGYTLSASSPDVTRTTSTGFDIHDQGTSCSGKCSRTLTQTGTVSQIPVSQTTQVTSNSSNAGLLTLALDDRSMALVDGTDYWTTTVANQCGGYVPLGPDTAIFNLISQTGAAKMIADTVTEPVSSGSAFKALVASQQMCFAAPVQFSAKPGSGGFGSLPNGSTGFIGLLDDCTNVDPTAQPCVTNRTGTYKQQIGNIEIDVSIPASFTGDPYRSH